MLCRRIAVFASQSRTTSRSVDSIVNNRHNRACHRGSNLESSLHSVKLSTDATIMSKESDDVRRPKIAAIAQLRSTSNKFRNLIDIATCAGLAKSQGASMLFLPECFGFMGESAAQTLQEAENPLRLQEGGSGENHEVLASVLASIIHNSTLDGSSQPLMEEATTKVHSLMDGLRMIAQESGLWISGGGIHVAGAPPVTTDGPPRVYNTHVILDSKGVLRASYRKIHLFDVSIPGKVELKESKTTAPGNELVVCDSPLGRLGVTTCYDLRFPETYTRLVEDMGAQILLVPSAFTIPTGAAHWHVLLRARAIENQCYVVASAQYGKHNHKRESFGHSLAVDPWGKILADAGGYPANDEIKAEGDFHMKTPDPPSIVTAEIDLEKIASIRQRMPIDLHRSNATF